MGTKITVRITEDTASPALLAIARSLEDRTGLHGALAGRGERVLRDHFAQRESEPNKRGWPKQHFWDQIRGATAVSRVDREGAEITVNDPRLAQKIYGGEIKPGAGKKYLALPAIAEAYGRSPGGVPNLHPLIRMISGERRVIALAENLASEIKFGRLKKDGSRTVTQTASRIGTIWYWLVKSVNQPKDQRALPTNEEFEQALLEEAETYARRIVNRP